MDPTRTTALITGASRGLGRALSEQLAAGGARVVLVARSEPELSAVVAPSATTAARRTAWPST